MSTNITDFNNLNWIRDQRFATKKGIKNVHTFFRKCVDLDDSEITEAMLTFSADDYCKIYINGTFVVSGPAPGYIHNYYYMQVDVKDYLCHGKNCIAIHSYYQGLKNRVWNSGDNLAGLKAQLAVSYKSGDYREFAADSSWRCFDCKAWQSEHTFGYETQFAENIDMRLIPAAWRETKFDDSNWNEPEVVSDYPHKLMKQPTAPLSWNNVYPVSITPLNEGRWLLDFGSEVVGCTVIKAAGLCGHVIEIRHAEELNSDGTARFQLRANCDYQECVTLSEAPMDTVELFDYKAFRYIELSNYPGIPATDDIFVYERHYPFDNVSELKTSDDTVNRIWDICSLAVKLGTQDSYLDCLTREKGAYLGDAFVTGLSHLYLTGRSEMLHKVLDDFAASAKFCPGLRAVSPGAFEQDIADYSLLWVPLLHEYYMWTGNSNFMREMMPVVDGILDYFGAFENAEGVLENFIGKPVMVDWPSNLRDDYDDPGLMGSDTTQKGINTLINLYYYGTLSTATKIYEASENLTKSVVCQQKTDALNKKLKEKFLGPNGFVDTDSSSHVSLHTNALALMFNAVTAEEAKLVISVLKEKRIKCGVYFSFFLLKGLFNYGEIELAYDLMTCDDIHSWQTMLKDGATTCMEAWGLDQKWNTSLCHPWASSPVYMIAAEVFGLKPAKPGWTKINFDPKIPKSMKSGSICINIPQGKLQVSFFKNKGKAEFHIKTPKNIQIT